jgi:putative ABC transport system permease protein
MLHNYLITALRNFTRHKLYSFINIAGLTVGFACVIFILLFLRDELSYDAWVPDSQNVYRVEVTFYPPGMAPIPFAATPFPIGPTMQTDIPGVMAQTHMAPQNMTAQVGDRSFPAWVDVVDPNFFQVIELPFAQGDPAAAFLQPESIVLSQATAKRFFGATNPIGKTLLMSGSHALTVTGILRDLPHNTHLVIDMIIPNTSKADLMGFSTKRNDWMSQWFDTGAGFEYIKLSPHADLGAVEKRLPPMLDRHVDLKANYAFNMRGSSAMHLHLTPFRRVHLTPFGDMERGSRWGTIYGFAAIAALIILIACINYMNLATARAMARAREVSLRKVMGATRKQLIAQFMGESVIMALIALVLASAIVEMLTPSFDSLLARPITYSIPADWPLTLSAVAVVILVGLLGGIYPALILSGFRPAANLGTSASTANGSVLLRSALVVLQFAVSIGLGITAIVIFAQISYSRQLDLGFDRHNLLVIMGAGPLAPSARQSLTQALAADPAIASAARSDLVPFGGGAQAASVGLPEGTRKFTVRTVNIDPNFPGVYGMKLLAGRYLSYDRGTDVFDSNVTDGRPSRKNILISNPNILINEVAARKFGYRPADAVGRTLIINASSRVTIVGVVGDVNFDGLQAAISPFVYFYDPANLGPISVRLKPGRTQEAVAAIDRIWHRFVPTVAIQRWFQDASFDSLLADDEREGRTFAIFVGIAIFIACLGLLGLAAFSTERRTKEIGIRKAHGARTRDIVLLLLWQFSIPVLIANLIAWPVAYYYLHQWLEGYAYRISLDPLYFIAAGVIALVIAWATVIAHAAHVARANPIHALRYE